jgi:DNA repair protein RadC
MYKWQRYQYKIVRNQEDERIPFSVTKPDLAADLFTEHAKDNDHESFWVIALDAQNNALGVEEIYRGSATGTAVRAAEVFRSAIIMNAVGMVVIHNHPSGSLEASPEDLRLTGDLVRAARLLDIDLLDHLVVNGKSEWMSIRAEHKELWYMDIPDVGGSNHSHQIAATLKDVAEILS